MMHRSRRSLGCLVPATLAAALLAGCASLPPAPADATTSPWALASGGPPARGGRGWTHQQFPGKAATRFDYVRLDGRDVLAVRADASASMLRRELRVEPAELGRVSFSWKVADLIAQADLALRDKADAPVRVVLVFEGDRSRLSARDAALSELVRAVTGEELPYATLMYVWCNQRAPGTVIGSARTSRIRKLVVESGRDRLAQWVDYERDIRADFVQAFGEAPGALVGIAVMTDTDNTRSQARAWYGPVRLLPPPAR